MDVLKATVDKIFPHKKVDKMQRKKEVPSKNC